MTRIPHSAIAGALSLLWPLTTLAAQQAATVSGHVTSGGHPVVGAHVRVADFGIDRVTNTDGRYSFVVSSSRVRGQSIKVVASSDDRRARLRPQTKAITLVGGEIVQDFELAVVNDDEPVVVADSAHRPSGGPRVREIVGDSLGLGDRAGLFDIASALVGRVPGLDVSPASLSGGSASMRVRGPQSILGSNEPLVVIDGIPIDNTVFTSAAQRFGLGGFDYGNPLGDFDLADVASVRVLSGPEASALFGGRGSNGVLLITTKTGAEGPGFTTGVTYGNAGGSALRLPAFQNSYGQGLAGKFEFLNGRGGGVNDAVGQNWGPALDGRPVAQGSYRQAGAADVRLWTAHPDNVRSYFESGRTSVVNVGAQGHSDLGSFRASVGTADVNGLTPRDRLARLNASAALNIHPVQRLNVGLIALASQTKRDNAPGTGFGEANPVFQFTHMGRQVDMDSLRAHLRDAAGKQISWNYTDHNNPYFAPVADNNYSHRFHTTGIASASYLLAPWLALSGRAGTDDVRDGRLFTIASGWMGGFPSYTGTGNFSKGGSQGDEVSARRTTGSLALDGVRILSDSLRWTFGVGVDREATREQLRSLGIDSVLHVPAAGAPDTAKPPVAASWIQDSRRNSAFARTTLTSSNGLSGEAGLRNAWASLAPGQHTSALLPWINGRMDLAGLMPDLRTNHVVRNVSLHAAWWKDATNTSAYDLETMYAGRTATGSFAPLGLALLPVDSTLASEITNGIEVGADVSLRRFGLTLGATYYDQRTSGVVLPTPDPRLAALRASNAAQVSNHGLEASASIDVGDGVVGLGWRMSASVAVNSNQVESLYGGVTSIPLAPPVAGLTLEAIPGQPLGVLSGFRMMRDPSSGLPLLRNGLPLPDSVAGPQRLGAGQPRQIFGLQNTLRYRWVSFFTSIDGRAGGSVFSLTNWSGDVAGTLAETAVRPDSGLLVAGLDVTTHRANTQRVSTEDYYHALGRIQEPWVYSASFWKLREARLTVDVPINYGRIPFHGASASLVGRNLSLSAKAPNIDPETVFSPYQVRGIEMGQLPSTRSVGLQFSIVP
jgi:TonB-dependent SusC/RagA subfamily outer membrane receptor